MKKANLSAMIIMLFIMGVTISFAFNGPDEPKREARKSNNIIYGSSLQNTAEPKETWKEEETNEIPKE